MNNEYKLISIRSDAFGYFEISFANDEEQKYFSIDFSKVNTFPEFENKMNNLLNDIEIELNVKNQ